MGMGYPVGKLPPDVLRGLLDRHAGRQADGVILGPGIGVDASVVSAPGGPLALKADPITFATDEIGWYAVNVNANDLACVGARPRWFLATLLLPESAGDILVERIFSQIAAACHDVGAVLVGGHTEATWGLDRPIVAGAMVGDVPPGRLIRPVGALPGDLVLLSKGCAVEGTAILAREKRNTLIQTGFSEGDVERMADFLHTPGIGVVRDASIAADTGDVHALHDPTEGGVATGLWEMAEASGVRIVVKRSAIPIFPETRRHRELFGLDPLGLIASGALLAVVSATDARAVLRAWAEEGIAGSVVGRVTEGKGVWDEDTGGSLPRFDQDELTRALG